MAFRCCKNLSPALQSSFKHLCTLQSILHRTLQYNIRLVALSEGRCWKGKVCLIYYWGEHYIRATIKAINLRSPFPVSHTECPQQVRQENADVCTTKYHIKCTANKNPVALSVSQNTTVMPGSYRGQKSQSRGKYMVLHLLVRVKQLFYFRGRARE